MKLTEDETIKYNNDKITMYTHFILNYTSFIKKQQTKKE